MGAKTKIEWTRGDDGTPGATWNPVTGCDKVSPGCDRCYAETFAERWRGTPGHYYENGFDVQLRPDKLDLPLRWTKPRRIFVNSMSDLFHDKVPDDYIARVFAVMALAPRHTFQVLTKRHGRMRSLLTRCEHSGAHRPGIDFRSAMAWAVSKANPDRLPRVPDDAETRVFRDTPWPLPNVWLGVSAEDQKRADVRIPALLETPAAVRFISAEPLLGPIDLTRRQFDSDGFELTYWLTGRPHWGEPEPQPCPNGGTIEMSSLEIGPRLDWVIVGGESGRGARAMHPDWARSLRDQCAATGVPFLFKQWGEHEPSSRNIRGYSTAADRFVYIDGRGDVALASAENESKATGAVMRRVGKARAGRELDGRTWDEYPEAVTA
ncbi:hypothetical protein E3G52_000306 [Mycobacteroides abscessus]|uniref:DUF5131 family protein n=1 Tax=Mycobacteroides abscessus TaxID=36809 RepID=UPI001878CE09|nr:phage Gp37/Gp68 family protein [Mycobacteroides abscessus]MBE5453442.1 hypothetical protein [Mycobacteroides abscessus]